jgi:hypothetical protein
MVCDVSSTIKILAVALIFGAALILAWRKRQGASALCVGVSIFIYSLAKPSLTCASIF